MLDGRLVASDGVDWQLETRRSQIGYGEHVVVVVVAAVVVVVCAVSPDVCPARRPGAGAAIGTGPVLLCTM